MHNTDLGENTAWIQTPETKNGPKAHSVAHNRAFTGPSVDMYAARHNLKPYATATVERLPKARSGIRIIAAAIVPNQACKRHCPAKQ